MHRVDALRGLVAQPVLPADADARLLGVQVGAELHPHHARLGDPVVALVRLLVPRLPRLPLAGGGVLVDHVGVVEDEAAQPGHQRPRDHGGGERRTAEAEPGQPGAPGHPRLLAAHPEQVGEHRQEHGPRGPVRLEPAEGLHEGPEAVHVGVGAAGAGVEAVEVVLQPEGVHHPAEHHVQDHQEVAHVLVVHQGVHQHHEHAEEEEPHQLDAEERPEVEPDLEVVVPLGRLRHDPRHQDHSLEDGDHQRQRGELPGEGDPVGDGGGVVHLVEAHVALLPHHLPRVEGDDDEQRRCGTWR